MRLGTFWRRRIFTPLGMTDTVAHEKAGARFTHRAYGPHQDNGRMGPDRSEFDLATLGDGGVYTSLDDLEKWSTHWPITHCSARKN